MNDLKKKDQKDLSAVKLQVTKESNKAETEKKAVETKTELSHKAEAEKNEIKIDSKKCKCKKSDDKKSMKFKQ